MKAIYIEAVVKNDFCSEALMPLAGMLKNLENTVITHNDDAEGKFKAHLQEKLDHVDEEAWDGRFNIKCGSQYPAGLIFIFDDENDLKFGPDISVKYTICKNAFAVTDDKNLTVLTHMAPDRRQEENR